MQSHLLNDPAPLNWLPEPALWVLGSLAIGLLASLLLWSVLRQDAPTAGRLRTFLVSPLGELLSWLLRLAWLIGPGYAALLLGVLSPRLIGLTQIDWGPGFGYGLAYSLLIWMALLAAGLYYRRQTTTSSPWPSWPAGLAQSVRLAGEAGALQWHWAFYRSAAIPVVATLGLTRPDYWGVWLAVGLIGLEAALSPLVWQDLRTPGRAEGVVLRALLLIATSVLYLISRNFWLAWVLHGACTLIVEPRLGARFDGGAPPASTAR